MAVQYTMFVAGVRKPGNCTILSSVTMTRLATRVAVALFVVLVVRAEPSIPARGWDQWRAIIWSTGTPADRNQWFTRLREIGFDAEQCSSCNAAPFVANQFGFYLENLVPELGFLNSRASIYQDDWTNYTRAPHDKRFLIRKPSLSDPAFWDTAQPRLQSLIRQYAPLQPLLYQLRDELSIGSFASPMDYDFHPRALEEFREWLKREYGSLDALNAEWETTFTRWEDVEPMTTYESKDRERAALAASKPENYASWADHRAFMDWSFAAALDRLRATIRTVDDVTPVGIEGTQMPSTFGGFDMWRLSRSVDWVEPYDLAGAREIWRSFVPHGMPVLSTVFGSDLPRIRQRLWWLLLNGDRGTIVWDDDASRSIEKTREGLPVTDRGRGLAEILRELKEAAPGIFRLTPEPARIAIHYSQASIRAHWMFDSREDRDTWPRRFSSYEAVWSRLARVRDGFMRVIHDLGHDFRFVSYEQLENGELERGGYRILLLPQSVAMSAEECRAVVEFVQAGGVVIADNMTATMDKHGKRLAKGQLDELFGIRRNGVGWRARAAGGRLGDLPVFEPDVVAEAGTAAATSDSGSPAIIVNRVGEGKAIYLNIGMHDYGKLRLQAGGAGSSYRDLFQSLLSEAGVPAALTVTETEDGTSVPCVRLWRYQGEDGPWFAVMRNPEFSVNSLKAAGYPDGSAIEVPVQVRVAMPDGRFLEAILEPWKPLIFPESALKLPEDEPRPAVAP